MRVLIIEDDVNKSRQLREFVSDQWPGAAIDERRSYQSGLTAIQDTQPNLVLLDMTLPTWDKRPGERGGRTRHYGGREILREMQRKGLAYPTIIVTAFDVFGEPSQRKTLEELVAELRSEFPTVYCGTVYYHHARSNWKTELRRLVRHAVPAPND